MNSIWKLFYKILGTINLIFGLIILYKLFEFYTSTISLMEKMNTQNELDKVDYSFFDLNFQFQAKILIGIFYLASGLLILLNKKLGWILAYSCWIMSILILIPMTIYGVQDVTMTTIGEDYWFQIYSGIALAISLIFLIFLSSKKIRDLNQITLNSFLWSFALVLFLSLPTILL